MSDVIQPHSEVSQSRTVVDPRSLWKKIWDAFEKPWIPLAWALATLPVVVLLPGTVLIVLLVQLILIAAVRSKPDVLPIHLPLEAGKEDMNDPKPGMNNGFYKARGSFYVGRIRATGVEVWMSFKALTQHWLIFGTTGAGKTESIVSYVVDYLSVGSGVAFQDAKAAPKAMIQMATLCRIFGRDGDFRVTNYITGLTSERRDPAERLSNDSAVFARGSAGSNTQLLVSLMPPSKGENQIFAERAVALVSATMPALTDLRDLGKIQIDPGVIRRNMGFKQFMELYRNNFISKKSRDALLGYLESLPGYDDTKEISQQPEEVTRQFGFAQAYFTRSLASLSDTYGHIYLVGQGEIDYQDAVLNGRILLTLLPSMEKAGEELANLGKIVLTATKNGMVVGLGTVFEGSAEDIVHSLPTNSEIPYGVLNDENAYMLVEGQEMLNAQARGLGFGILTGTQDAPGMLENISKTTKQIMANSAVKQIMYLDDKETTALAVEFSGEANVMARNSFEIDGDLNNVYASKNIVMERRPRLNATAIKKQGLGQAFVMYQGKVHEMQVFNHGIQERSKDPRMCYVSHWYSVRMAKVKIPTEDTLRRMIAVDPRPEWTDLLVMVNDESRAMLKEMTTYFASMLKINEITDKFKSTQYEEPTGLLKTIADNAPKSSAAVPALYELLLEEHETERTMLRNLGDHSGLDEALGFADNLDFGDAQLEEQIGSGSSGGGSAGGLKNQTADINGPDPLDSWLGEELAIPTQNDADTAYSDFLEQQNQPWAKVPDTTEPDLFTDPLDTPTSALAGAVQRNLSNMPWMASAVDYHQVRNDQVEVEAYFVNDRDEAERRVDEALGYLADGLEYSTTPMPKEPLKIDAMQADLLALFRDNNGGML